MITLAWFDRWLEDIPNGIDKTDAPLSIRAIWRWRPRDIRSSRPQFSTAGSTATASSHRPPADADAADRLDYTGIDNPCNRQTIGQYTGGLLDFVFRLCNADNPCTEWLREPTAGREYTMDPVTEPTVLAGPGSVALYASSSSTEAHTRRHRLRAGTCGAQGHRTTTHAGRSDELARPLITEFLDRVAVTLTAAVRPG